MKRFYRILNTAIVFVIICWTLWGAAWIAEEILHESAHIVAKFMFGVAVFYSFLLLPCLVILYSWAKHDETNRE